MLLLILIILILVLAFGGWGYHGGAYRGQGVSLAAALSFC